MSSNKMLFLAEFRESFRVIIVETLLWFLLVLLDISSGLCVNLATKLVLQIASISRVGNVVLEF